MKYVLDAHTHTIASGHAYSTIREMAKAASEKGLELLDYRTFYENAWNLSAFLF